MKNLLVAIDFSKNAIHALEYALLFADRLKANVSMIWVDNCVGPDLMIDRPDGESRHESRTLFNEIMEKYKGTFPKVKLDFRLSKGKVFEEISRYAQKIKADLIFAGTHGVTGFEEYWIGSNAYRIVTHAPCPVITLRQNFKFGKEIRKILMPIDSTLQSSGKVYTTAEIAKSFGADIFILAVHTSNLGSIRRQVDKHLGIATDHLKEMKIEYNIEEISTKNITQDTIDFAVKNKIDLISIMTEQETTQANVFLGTFARQLVNNCPVPLMSVRVPSLINR
ncbi:MAG TPA: universal stress protein [Bacteroidales bacterium]|nr:universal stress protein [Bacteroidales bacterium]